MNRPIIGVTTSARSGWRIFPLVALNIWFAGGRAVRWGAGRPADMDTVDGVIIGGGDDISPDLYGGALVASARLNPERDELECALVSEAMAQHKPVLGICRGAQMLNVALGGTLDQNAYASFPDSRFYKTILPRKTVNILADTQLIGIAGPDEMRVNALHTQAVKELGSGLRIAARDDGGMVQAVERVRDPFALGVQWHPEHLIYAHRQRAIFRALVGAARAGKEAGDQIGAAGQATA